jgi:hypothetical protein
LRNLGVKTSIPVSAPATPRDECGTQQLAVTILAG